MKSCDLKKNLKIIYCNFNLTICLKLFLEKLINPIRYKCKIYYDEIKILKS